MARIVYRGAYATFPMVGLTPGDLAYATDLLMLFEWNGVAWIAYEDYPDYEGGKSKLLSIGDWASINAEEMLFTAFGLNQAWGAAIFAAYVVPAGSTLFISWLSGAIWASLAASADLNQICTCYIANLTTGLVYGYGGGNGGYFTSKPVPVRVEGGETVRFYIINHANHVCDLYVSAGGYEI